MLNRNIDLRSSIKILRISEDVGEFTECLISALLKVFRNYFAS